MVRYFRSNVALATAVVAGLFLVSCSGGDNGGGTQVQTTGSLTVTVNADGSPRAGVTVHRFAPGSATAAATLQTGNNGTLTFGNVPEGSWEVEIELPAGFALDTGEQMRKGATVVAGQTANAAFAIVDTFVGETVLAQGNLTFSQANLTISAGTTVRWINDSGVLHTVTPDGHSEWSDATLAQNGDVFMFTFNNTGSFDYFCTPHQTQGMTGTITVN